MSTIVFGLGYTGGRRDDVIKSILYKIANPEFELDFSVAFKDSEVKFIKNALNKIPKVWDIVQENKDSMEIGEAVDLIINPAVEDRMSQEYVICWLMMNSTTGQVHVCGDKVEYSTGIYLKLE